MERPLPTWPIAAGSLAIGFGVAVATGVRPLGGLVLLAALIWCVPRWYRAAGIAGAVGLTLAYAAAFAGSHGLGHVIGAWPSVALVSAAMGGAAWAVADGRDRVPAR